MKYTTVLFKDANKDFNIGEVEDGKIIGFNMIVVNVDMKDAAAFQDMKLNEFMLLTVEKKASELKLTPMSIGSLSANIPIAAKAGTPNVPAEVYLIPREKLLEMFNNVIGGK